MRSVRCASYSLIGLKCTPLWCGLFGGRLGERKNNSVTVLILNIDKCLFEIKNHSLQKKKKKNCLIGTSLVAQWLRIHLPMQGTQVQALVREDHTCRRATKARAPQLLSPRATTNEACVPRARAPQQEKPSQ